MLVFSVIRVMCLVIIISTVAFSQEQQEILLSINSVNTSGKLNYFNNGESLRSQNKFSSAIEEYKKVLGPGELCGKEANAQYNIALCYSWLGKVDIAERWYNDTINLYSENTEIVAYSKFGIAWVKTKKQEFETAIDLYNRLISKKSISDEELYSVAMFQIGKIYLIFLKEPEKAKQLFNEILSKYPNANIIEHPYFEIIKN